MLAPSMDTFFHALDEAEALVVGAGSGLSTAAGLRYSGERFYRYFQDFHDKYGFTDMYRPGFYNYKTAEGFWAFRSRSSVVNRFDAGPLPLYQRLVGLLKNHDYFVITTNVDHQFQLSGVDKDRLYYMQGDYGSFQCSKPCSKEVYDGEETLRAMNASIDANLEIDGSLIPQCPRCGAPLMMHMRMDHRFVEPEGLLAARRRYNSFLNLHNEGKVVYLELGVGYNTPIIIKYPFWERVMKNEEAIFVTVNAEDTWVPEEILSRTLAIKGDIKDFVDAWARRKQSPTVDTH